jgi:hypothetical protein
MKIPVGYVCLDILTGTANDRTVFRAGCDASATRSPG